MAATEPGDGRRAPLRSDREHSSAVGDAIFPAIKPGVAATIHHTVTEQDTIGNHLPDDMEKLFSTPALVSLMIEASVQAVDGNLPDGFLSVGKSSEVFHDAPSVIGATLQMTATIREFDGYHVTLDIRSHDESGAVAHGTHVRTIVNKRWLQLKIGRRIARM